MQAFIQRHRVFLLHLSFWFVYMSFLVYQTTSRPRGKTEMDLDMRILYMGVQLVVTLIITYLNYFFALPRFLRHKHFGRYLLEISIPFIIFITIRIYVQRYLMDGYEHRDYFYSTLFAVQTVSITLFIMIFVGMIRFAVDWFEFESKKKEVENEKLMAELNFLKAQINPHFLFNTLNNLYFLVFTKSDNATEVIAKLSQMMRYMIYDSNHAQVQLSREIEYMQNYIDLERLRLNNEIPIQLSVQGNPDDVSIAPLILITFLENAFKHGISNNKPDAWIRIFITLNGKRCIYTVENSKPRTAHAVAGGKSGIGLQNVCRRLELSYPERYELKTEDLPDRYKVELNITLS